MFLNHNVYSHKEITSQYQARDIGPFRLDLMTFEKKKKKIRRYSTISQPISDSNPYCQDCRSGAFSHELPCTHQNSCFSCRFTIKCANNLKNLYKSV